MSEEFRIYAVGIMVCQGAHDAEGQLHFWYQTPGLVFARSQAEAVSQAYGQALEQYPEDQGYSNHQAVAVEVTAEFLRLARTLKEPPANDPRQGERAIMGQAVDREEEIPDSETPM